MGGKNPTIVTKNADIDKATDGVLRSAFGFGGQKCSACSRVYVEREVYDDFLSTAQDQDREDQGRQPDRARRVPRARSSTSRRWRPSRRPSEEARKNGTIVTGGAAHHRGRLRPRAVRRAHDRRGARATAGCGRRSCSCRSSPWRPFDELDDAIEKANDTEYGLTAGLLQRGRGRDRRVARPDPGRRRVREPAGRLDHRRVAGRAAVRRLEGVGHDRQGRRRPLLRHCSTCGSSRGR